MKVIGGKTGSLKIKSNIRFFLLLFLAAHMMGCVSGDLEQKKGGGAMKVKVVSLENCGATPPTIALVKEVAAEMDLAVDLEHAIVKTPGDAVMQRHIGSPTVQINGLDIDPGARGIEQFGVT